MARLSYKSLWKPIIVLFFGFGCASLQKPLPEGADPYRDFRYYFDASQYVTFPKGDDSVLAWNDYNAGEVLSTEYPTFDSHSGGKQVRVNEKKANLVGVYRFKAASRGETVTYGCLKVSIFDLTLTAPNGEEFKLEGIPMHTCR